MMRMITWRIYENIKFLCKQKGISMATIESLCGYTPGYLSRRKDKQGDIPVKIVTRAAELLDVDISELMFTPMGMNARRIEIEEQIAKLKSELSDLEEESEE